MTSRREALQSAVLLPFAALPARAARVGCIALNTRFLDEREAKEAVAETEAETGVPTDDPVRFGPTKLLDTLLQGPAAQANRPQGLLSG